eukprot:CAMPEP_0198125322 /NCGR_PEP_ID=MMETSP1442-20131203/42331_1 /TAXON_ID= /ORGANISM="Craspedostauros australis, Strain CCMP3328" /LENGTH=85 /DNA_ID=CAMNT_0043784903 /DNA_START=33 /DNA_END=287 /DNA_ORIENTATION=+
MNSKMSSKQGSLKRKYSRADPCSSSCFNRFLEKRGGATLQNSYMQRAQDAVLAQHHTEVERDDLLLKEMNSLTLEERKRAQEDIH